MVSSLRHRMRPTQINEMLRELPMRGQETALRQLNENIIRPAIDRAARDLADIRNTASPEYTRALRKYESLNTASQNLRRQITHVVPERSPALGGRTISALNEATPPVSRQRNSNRRIVQEVQRIKRRAATRLPSGPTQSQLNSVFPARAKANTEAVAKARGRGRAAAGIAMPAIAAGTYIGLPYLTEALKSKVNVLSGDN